MRGLAGPGAGPYPDAGKEIAESGETEVCGFAETDLFAEIRSVSTGWPAGEGGELYALVCRAGSGFYPGSLYAFAGAGGGVCRADCGVI